MGQPRPLFVLFSFFSITILQKIVDLSGIRTRIVGVESEHADHLTTTTAHQKHYLNYIFHSYLIHENFIISDRSLQGE